MTQSFWLPLGILLAVVFIRIAKAATRDEGRDEHTLYAIGLVTAALIYVGFASLNGGSGQWIVIECVGLVLYGGVAIAHKKSPWWLVLGWAAHPLWDLALHLSGSGSTFVPKEYALLCLSFDLLIAIHIARTQLKPR